MYDDNYVQFQYTSTDRNTGEKTDYDYKVQLTTTPCNFGGVRYWFTCPLSRNGVYCGRRVGKLYKAPGASYFGCRHCYNLSYESRNETRSGMFGAFGGVLRVERQMEELRSQINRWTYQGRPTRKVRKLHALEQSMESCLCASQKYLKHRMWFKADRETPKQDQTLDVERQTHEEGKKITHTWTERRDISIAILETSWKINSQNIEALRA